MYLRETPAEPLSPTTKAILWIVGIIVAMLFLAALWKVSHPRRTKARTKIAEPVAKTAMLPGLFHFRRDGEAASETTLEMKTLARRLALPEEEARSERSPWADGKLALHRQNRLAQSCCFCCAETNASRIL